VVVVVVTGGRVVGADEEVVVDLVVEASDRVMVVEVAAAVAVTPVPEPPVLLEPEPLQLATVDPKLSLTLSKVD